MSGVWLYQGLVPKLWKVDAGEVALWQRVGLSRPAARTAVRTSGAAEVAFAIITIAGARRRWPFAATAVAMPLVAAGAAKADRRVLTGAFNPASLNWAMTALAVVALATTDGRPSGRRPLRAAPDTQPDVGALP